LVAPSTPDHAPESDRERLDRIESELSTLRVEVASLRARCASQPEANMEWVPLARPIAAPADLSTMVPDRPSPAFEPYLRRARRAGPPLEELIGRYGMLALATVTVLVGVGSFLGWAISQGLLGPTVRVALGSLGAIALAAAGVRLRAREMRDFGNVLLALALAVTHVVCWSAGPLLHVIPSWAALAVASTAGLVLAEFALRHEEEALFCIGFGGAALAPFVTSERAGSMLALAGYGLAVIALAAAALRDREWQIARRVVAAAFVVYLGAVGAGRGISALELGTYAAVERLAMAGYAVAFVAAAAVLVHPRHRRGLLRLGTWGLAAAAVAYSGPGEQWMLAFAITVAGAALVLALLYLTASPATDALARADEGVGPMPTVRLRGLLASPFADGALLPVVLYAATLSIIPDNREWGAVAYSMVWAIALVGAAFRARAEPAGQWYPFAASAAALGVAGLAPLEMVSAAGAMTAVGLSLAAIHARLPRTGFALGAGAVQVTATLGVMGAVHLRTDFAYRPFLEAPSLAAMVVFIGWLVLPALLESEETMADPMRAQRMTVVRWTTAAVGFFWVQGELQGAYSATAAFALLVGYYAITGFAAIEWGRHTGARALRIAGLGLTVFAAWKSLLAVLALDDIAVRVGVLFLVSAFLIGVAYRYRRALGAAAAPETPAG
jgi:hypothetical protein